jgi:DNA-directed RNA polymerase specialized sigma24 family protein
VQEVFTRLFVMEGWATIATPRAYVVRMLRNLAIERIRRSRIVEFQRLADVDSLNFVGEAPDPFRATDAREEMQRMWAELHIRPEAADWLSRLELGTTDEAAFARWRDEHPARAVEFARAYGTHP